MARARALRRARTAFECAYVLLCLLMTTWRSVPEESNEERGPRNEEVSPHSCVVHSIWAVLHLPSDFLTLLPRSSGALWAALVHCPELHRLFPRSTSGNASSGSISTDLTVAAPAMRAVCVRVPASHGSTGSSSRSTRPSARVIASRTGIGARPRSSTVTTRDPSSSRTDPTAWSRVHVSNHQVRQNQSRSRPATSSKVFQKSYGVGCLLIQ